jgi:hypothetical protein
MSTDMASPDWRRKTTPVFKVHPLAEEVAANITRGENKDKPENRALAYVVKEVSISRQQNDYIIDNHGHRLTELERGGFYSFITTYVTPVTVTVLAGWALYTLTK